MRSDSPEIFEKYKANYISNVGNTTHDRSDLLKKDISILSN